MALTLETSRWLHIVRATGLGAGLMIGVSITGCTLPDRSAESPAAPVVGSFHDFFVVHDSIVLEEDPNTINVHINLQIDRDGSFLIADESEHRVRRYREDGSLVWQVGRRGRGPGEFEVPVALFRDADESFVAVERNGRVQFWSDTALPELLRGFTPGLQAISGAWPLGDGSMLVAGSEPGNPAGPRLHLRHPNAPDGPSFFRPLDHAANPEVAVVAGWTHASTNGSVLAVTFAAIDSIFFFDHAGAPRGSIPLGIPGFRPVTAGPSAGTMSPQERVEWLARFDYLSDVHWVTDELLLVGFQSLIPEEGLGRRRHLAAVTPSGEVRFVYRDGPRLLAVDRERARIYFQDTSMEWPNRLLSARLRDDRP